MPHYWLPSIAKSLGYTDNSLFTIFDSTFSIMVDCLVGSIMKNQPKDYSNVHPEHFWHPCLLH